MRMPTITFPPAEKAQALKAAGLMLSMSVFSSAYCSRSAVHTPLSAALPENVCRQGLMPVVASLGAAGQSTGVTAPEGVVPVGVDEVVALDWVVALDRVDGLVCVVELVSGVWLVTPLVVTALEV